VRTFFVELPGDDWFAELTDFYRTDVDVPATVTVDGVVYQDVGVQFRGNTSFMMAPGRKKSLDLAFDFADKKQSLHGVRNLDLLNCNGDASSLREMLHGWIANQFLPAPRVALARVVVNGEDYGVYAAVQQFDKEFLEDHFGTKQGDRFKVPPDFSGNGGLRFLGEEPQAYQRNYELKSAESEQAWQGLVDVCAALENAPADRLEAILPQHLDVEATLWFLAVDNALGDDDGYFSRASDYLLYRDPKGALPPDPARQQRDPARRARRWPRRHARSRRRGGWTGRSRRSGRPRW
jgi:spore coat protein CotH